MYVITDLGGDDIMLCFWKKKIFNLLYTTADLSSCGTATCWLNIVNQYIVST